MSRVISETTRFGRCSTAATVASAVGRRDFAILTVLVRLGLRAGEVARLELGDIDWHRGEARCAGEGRARRTAPTASRRRRGDRRLAAPRPSPSGRQRRCSAGCEHHMALSPLVASAPWCATPASGQAWRRSARTVCAIRRRRRCCKQVPASSRSVVCSDIGGPTRPPSTPRSTWSPSPSSPSRGRERRHDRARRTGRGVLGVASGARLQARSSRPTAARLRRVLRSARRAARDHRYRRRLGEVADRGQPNVDRGAAQDRSRLRSLAACPRPGERGAPDRAVGRSCAPPRSLPVFACGGRGADGRRPS